VDAQSNNGLSQAAGCFGQTHIAVNAKMTAAIFGNAEKIGLIGQSVCHRDVLWTLSRASQVDAEVLLIGETGVGKELYARFVHASSPRASGEFVAINCGAIPEALFENEMFGHSAGAYTDAGPRAEGLVAAADGGSLFLDEVDSLPPATQVKLLRLLQEKEYRRLGDTRLRRANIRVISAMNGDPEKAISDRRLREDLYYRLNVISKRIPPLRERPDDIMVLTREFVRRYWMQYRSAHTPTEESLEFSLDAEQLLQSYHWPGNVRQLQNMIRSLVCQQSGSMVECESLPIAGFPASVASPANTELAILLTLSFCEAKQRVVDHFENKYLREVLRRAGGNICHAAQLAGKHRRAFFELMKKHGIESEEFRERQCTSIDMTKQIPGTPQ